MIKIKIYKDERHYSIEVGNDFNWIHSQDEDGWIMNHDQEEELHDAIFDVIDKFFYKYM
jgi:hypothetical protein